MAIINGTAGDDLILGGLGDNTLTGGLGRDIFELMGIPKIPNTITDFDPIDDTIQVDLPSGSKLSDLTTVQVENDAVINFGSDQLAVIKNTLVSALENIVVVVDADVSLAPPTVIPTPTASPGISLIKNRLTTDATIKGLRINTVSRKAGGKVNEIGIFAVDDATGKIGNIMPGTVGYLKAVTDSARSIFSTLDGNFFNTSNREIELDPNKTYEFFEVQDGSISDIQQQLASGRTPNNILFAHADSSENTPIKVTSNNERDGYRVSVNNDELVLNVVQLDDPVLNIEIGSQSQDLSQGRTIDLTEYAGQILKVDLVTTSSAAYDNNIGFYAVEDTIGTIKLTDGSTLKPGDANYAVEAIKSAVLQAGKTDNKPNQDLAGGKNYAPVVVAQGSLTDFVSKNPTNSGDGKAIHAYFNYIGANSDKIDHFRLIGNNTFGVEDIYGGGDRDFNDLVIKATFQS